MTQITSPSRVMPQSSGSKPLLFKQTQIKNVNFTNFSNRKNAYNFFVTPILYTCSVTYSSPSNVQLVPNLAITKLIYDPHVQQLSSIYINKCFIV